MDKIIKPVIIQNVADVIPRITRFAYYMEPMKGGYQLHRLSIQEDVVLADEKIEDPDGWPEVLGYLEAQFTKEHFSE